MLNIPERNVRASMDAKLAPDASRMSVAPSGTIDSTRITCGGR